MSLQTVSKARDGNPRTIEEARLLVKQVESLFMPWNVEALVNGFTPDCVIRFCDLPEFTGHEKLRALFAARSKRQKKYKLVKTLKAFAGDTIANTWVGEWEDVQTGKKMRGFGCEVWLMRDGKVHVWDGAFNASPVGSSEGMSSLLT